MIHREDKRSESMYRTGIYLKVRLKHLLTFTCRDPYQPLETELKVNGRLIATHKHIVRMYR
jgi:hypothetical protein